MTISFDWTAERVELLRSLWLEGFSASMIGKRLGCSRSSVLGKSHREGFAAMRNQFTNGRAIPGKNQRHKAAPRTDLIWPVRKKGEPVPNGPEPILVCGEPVTIENVRDGLCRWPHGQGLNIQFCGHPTHGYGVYCGIHMTVAYDKPTTPRGSGLGRDNSAARQFGK